MAFLHNVQNHDMKSIVIIRALLHKNATNANISSYTIFVEN